MFIVGLFIEKTKRFHLQSRTLTWFYLHEPISTLNAQKRTNQNQLYMSGRRRFFLEDEKRPHKSIMLYIYSKLNIHKIV